MPVRKDPEPRELARHVKLLMYQLGRCRTWTVEKFLAAHGTPEVCLRLSHEMTTFYTPAFWERTDESDIIPPDPDTIPIRPAGEAARSVVPADRGGLCRYCRVALGKRQDSG